MPEALPVPWITGAAQIHRHDLPHARKRANEKLTIDCELRLLVRANRLVLIRERVTRDPAVREA